MHAAPADAGTGAPGAVTWDGRAVPGRPGTLVTPEAVVLDLRTASLGSRTLARILDLLSLLAVVFAVSVITELLGGSELIVGVISAFLVVFVVFVYPALLEALWRGRTLGKAAVGLRVVSADGGPIGARQAIVRSLLLPIDVIVGAASILVSRRDQRIGDVLAGTVVRREVRGTAGATPTWFAPPWGLEWYVAHLDASRMTGDEHLVARAVLLRWGQLAAGSRQQVAAAIAGPIAVRLGHQVPPGLPPELYLHCLLAARQARDLEMAPVAPAAPAWGPAAPVDSLGR